MSGAWESLLCILSRDFFCFPNLFRASLAVQVPPLEIMLKQYSLSEGVINHQLDKSSGHCWRVMSEPLTFNTFGLLLVSWIISPPMMMGQKTFCVLSTDRGDYVTFFAQQSSTSEGWVMYLWKSRVTAARKVLNYSLVLTAAFLLLMQNFKLATFKFSGNIKHLYKVHNISDLKCIFGQKWTVLDPKSHMV